MARQTLLLVDTDTRSMRMLEVSLRKAGFDVVMARDGREALDAVERHGPDLIISDTRLGALAGDVSPLVPRDGYDLCERLKADEATARIPFMFLTGAGELDDKIRGLKLGVEDYLTKPIYLKELLTRVQLVLARKRRESMAAGGGRASFVGELGGMGLVDLLTTIDLGRKTGVIDIDGPEGQGCVIFREGRVVDAIVGALRGERAIYQMLRWNDGRFRANFGVGALQGRHDATTVSLGMQGLMLEGLRRADEWNHLESQLGTLQGPWELDRDALARYPGTLDAVSHALVDSVERNATVLGVIEASDDDVMALGTLVALHDAGVLRRVGGPTPVGRVPSQLPPREDVDALDRIFAEAPPEPIRSGEANADPGTTIEEKNTVATPAPEGGTTPASNEAISTTAGDGPGGRANEGRDDPRRRQSSTQHQERNVAKHKGKRGKGKHDAGASERPSLPVTGANPAIPGDASKAQPGSAPTARAETLPDKGLRVEGNVIHLPVPATVAAAQAREAEEGSGLHPTPAQRPSDKPEVEALREAEGERQRATVPPTEEKAEPAGDTKAEEASSTADAKTEEPKPATDARPERSFFDPEGTTDSAAKTETNTETKTETRADAKTETRADPKPPADDKKADDAKRTKLEITATRKEEARRDRKESLSTHLSDEARAFFSDQAYQAAYKSDHDTFEDLVPAAEDHAHEAARSRRWMTISGGVFVALLVAVVAFAAYHSQYAVHETSLTMPRPSEAPVAPEQTARVAPAPPPTEPAVAAPAPTPAPEPTTPPAAAAPAVPAATPTPSTPEPAPVVATATPTPEPAPAAPTPAPAATAPTPTPTTPTPAAPAVPAAPTPATAAPSAQTPQQLLAAARGFRGPIAGRVAAYNTYFDAAPQDDRTMATFAMSLAEMGRSADAEGVATRATTANPNNAQAWFVLAYARNALHNAAGAREAKTRCVALGGQWAAECRAL